MNNLTSKTLPILALAAAAVGVAVIGLAVAILLFPSGNTVSADSRPQAAVVLATPDPTPSFSPEPTPAPLPAFTPAPTPAPVKKPKVLPVVKAVKPQQSVRPGLPLICQSQSYTPEREAQCPNSAPIRKVEPANLTVTPLSSPAPSPTLMPVPTVVPRVSPAPTLAPSPAPSPSPTPTPQALITPSPTPAARSCGDYPALLCNADRDTLVDPWGMLNRECVSYAAYRVAQRRTMPYWGGHGNASQWPDNARAAGIPVDYVPRAGDVAIFMTGTGHAMYVESVDGAYITVSQFNYNATGEYSQMIVPAAGLTFIHF